MSSWAQIASKNAKPSNVSQIVSPQVPRPQVSPPQVSPPQVPPQDEHVSSETSTKKKFVKQVEKEKEKPKLVEKQNKSKVDVLVPRNINKDVYLVDIGSNLTSPKFSGDVDNVIKRAKTVGVKKQIITGCTVKESQHALKIASRYPGEIYSTAGIHPHYANEYTPECIKDLKELASHPEVVAIGETGLDFFRNISTPEKQRESFKAHLELAIRLNKPLFLHQRDAHSEFMDVFQEVMTELKISWTDLPPIVVHCFTGKSKELVEYIKVGFYIGITGFIGIKGRGDQLLNFLAHKVPLEKLMIETDAPYMKPNNAPKLASGHNEPCNLPYIAEIIAPLYNITEEAFWSITTKNAEKFFNI